MKIVVIGSLNHVPLHANICKNFVSRLGEIIVERDHTLLTGCRGSLDEAIAKSASNHLKKLKKVVRERLLSYRLGKAKSVFYEGTIHISSLKDWELTHPQLIPPEHIAKADVAIFIAGSEGTYIAANWARIAGIPVLGVAQFGGAGKKLYKHERKQIQDKYKYAKWITKDDFEKLNTDTLDVDVLAQEVISLAERIVTPNTVFTVMPFAPEFLELYASYRDICRKFRFEAVRTDEEDANEPIVQRIIEGIKTSAFVIADVSPLTPNVFYELGFAQGFGKQVIVTAKKGTQLPFDIKDVPVILWDDDQEKFKKQLLKRVGPIAARLGRSGDEPPSSLVGS